MEYGENLINQYLLIREKYLLALQDNEKEEDDISNA
jgi:hypothetical protein